MDTVSEGMGQLCASHGSQQQVATLPTVIGEEARDVYSTFSWTKKGDCGKIATVLEKFRAYWEPGKNIPFEQYKFNRLSQEAGESYEQYRTALQQLAANCEFGTLTPDELLRDRLVFGIRDHKTRERLLREPALTLTRFAVRAVRQRAR